MKIQDLILHEDADSLKSSINSLLDMFESSDHHHSQHSSDNKVQKPNLTNQERQKIYDILNKSSFNGKLPRGILSEISEKFKVKPRTISRIWHQGQESIASGLESANVSSRIKFKSGRKKNLVDHHSNLVRRKPKFNNRTKSVIWIS